MNVATLLPNGGGSKVSTTDGVGNGVPVGTRKITEVVAPELGLRVMISRISSAPAAIAARTLGEALGVMVLKILLSDSTRSILKAFTDWPVTSGGCALAGTELASNANTRTSESTANLFLRDFMRSLLEGLEY